jgi:hypothetical protein
MVILKDAASSLVIIPVMRLFSAGLTSSVLGEAHPDINAISITNTMTCDGSICRLDDFLIILVIIQSIYFRPVSV